MNRLRISSQMQNMMAYRKMAGKAPRMLVLKSTYWLDDACLTAAQSMGWETSAVPVKAEGILPRDQFEYLLRSLFDFKPDFVLTINLGGMDEQGLLARLFEDLHVPYVAWFVDDPRTIIMDRTLYASTYGVALTWEKTYLAYLAVVGFESVHFLPLAVNTALFNAVPATEWRLPATFVGNSMTQQAETEWRWLADHPALWRALQDVFETDVVTRENFARGLDAILPSSVLDQTDAEERRHMELLLFCEGTRRLRRAMVKTFNAEELLVFGDEDWKEICSQGQGYVSYETGLAAFYQACAVNLNSTSIQMATAVNQRVFDCPAAGGFLLTDAQSDLYELFEPDEIAVYNSLDECAELSRWYLTHPDARAKITDAARRRVLSQHTYIHRLRTIADIIRDRFSA